jgi:hypothetical protein
MALFAATCLLSIVSFYTTQQGMALYLSAWFALLAALGIQTALVIVAWLVGFTRGKRALLVAVYTITAVVSIAFSYVSLYTWFSARERPATIQRRLYDRLAEAAGKTEEMLAGAIGEQQRHVLALDEMAAAERSLGHISRAQDADPYLARVREAVAKEAQTYAASYREGAGEGVRYTAFERYAKMARQTLEQLRQARQGLLDFRARVKPLDSSEQQLKAFHAAYNAVPWREAEEASHAKVERPAAPSYAEFVDKSASGQEDLMIAFTELMTNPGGRPLLSLALAAFIDIVIFLLAYASGPYFHGTPEQRWSAAGASMDEVHAQCFVRDFLAKARPGRQGMPRVEAEGLSVGERQFCMLLGAKGMAVAQQEEGRLYYLLDSSVHESLVDSLARGGLPLRATPQRSPA